jgi:hypothetical protein
MSSLAGALLDVDVPAETASGPYIKQDEEMGDLFGEDANVDYVHHTWGSVLFQLALPTLSSSYSCTNQREPTGFSGAKCSGIQLLFPHLSTTTGRWFVFARPKRRQALEYEEDEEPNPIIEHRLEASVSIPNIPLPKSSDGQVRLRQY